MIQHELVLQPRGPKAVDRLWRKEQIKKAQAEMEEALLRRRIDPGHSWSRSYRSTDIFFPQRWMHDVQHCVHSKVHQR